MATLTITVTTPQTVRAAAAFGAKLGLPGSATNEEMRLDVINYIKTITLDYETRNAINAAVASIVPITPT